MRRVADFADRVTAGIATGGVARRQVVPSSPGITCVVLIRHGESKSGLAWLISDTGVHRDAVWVPKSMLTIEQPSERGVLVATLSRDLCLQKGLSYLGRWIDPGPYNQATRDVLAKAVASAARKRNALRKHRQGHARHDTQSQFC